LTVGIGVLCEDARTAVLASDMRVTYGKAADAPHHDRAGKQYGVPPFNFSVAIAGSTSSTHAVISELANTLSILLRAWQEQRKERPNTLIAFENVRNAIEAARKRELRRLQACAFESELGVSVHDWIAGKTPTGMPFTDYAMNRGLKVLQQVKDEMQYDMAIIVAGFLRESPIFFRAIGAKPIEESASPEIHVIGGKGAKEARQVLNDRQQNVGMTLARTLVHVYEALKAARSDRGVGDPDGYLVMRPFTSPAPNGTLRFHPQHPTIVGWSKQYALTSTEPLDGQFANDLVIKGLRVHRARKYDWLGAQKLMWEL
jgi:hypothetical protein